MPVHIRALIVICVLAAITYAFARSSACVTAIAREDFDRRRNLWFAVTLVTFLAHNYWIYIGAVATLLSLTVSREKNKLSLYFFLLFAIPPFGQKIGGLGIINHLFEIHYLRLLSLTILLPAFLSLRKNSETPSFGTFTADKFLFGYLALKFLLLLDASTITNAVRIGIFYAFLDVFLPYYVASRSLKSIQHFRDAIMSFVVAALVLSAIGAFEATRHWLLYASLDEAMGFKWSAGDYLMRDDFALRAQATTGQPIPLGYAMAVAVGFYLFFRNSLPNKKQWLIGLAALISGLIAPFSRGPWVGALIIIVIFVASAKAPMKKLAQLFAIGACIFSALLLTPWAEKVISLLPFVGTVEEFNVQYRQRLLEIGINLILQNPFFGAYNFFLTPEMEELKQGNGMIDLVNTYLAVGLGSGLTGLSLFTGVFATVALGVFGSMRKLNEKSGEVYILGQVIISLIAGTSVIIFTVSSITIIPIIYWSIAGIGTAYIVLVKDICKKENAVIESNPAI